jgi:amino acid permease
LFFLVLCILDGGTRAHYNAPKFYWELKDNTIDRFNQVVRYSFAGAMILMSTVAAAGFGTFGKASHSLILSNYSTSDQLMSLSRMAVTMSLICTYPLAFVGVRNGVLDLFNIQSIKVRNQVSNPLSILLLVLITSFAFVLKDIRIILALGGATWGNCVIYLFPALMLHHAASKYPSLQSKVPFAVGTGLFGLGLGIVGTWKAIQSIK